MAVGFCAVCVSGQASVRIGGIFNMDGTRSKEEAAFRFAIERTNAEIRGDPSVNKTLLTPETQNIRGNDTFETTKKVCNMLRLGVATVFGPITSQDSTAVRSVCDSMDVPHIQTHWDYRKLEPGQNTINMYPSNEIISKALSDLVLQFKWKDISIIYDDEEGLSRLQGVFQLSLKKDIRITIYDSRAMTSRAMMKKIKSSGASHIIIDCSRKFLRPLLEKMMEFQMLMSYFHYIITPLDTFSIDLTRYTGDFVNITALQLIDMENTDNARLVQDFSDHVVENLGSVEDPGMTLEAALVYDAVSLTSSALHRASGQSGSLAVRSLSCERSQSWDNGLTLYNDLESTTITGLTGNIQFAEGERSDVLFHITSLTENGMKQIGHWQKESGVEMYPVHSDQSAAVRAGINRTLIVTTVLEKPFVMFRETEDGRTLEGNEKFQGFCIDLLRHLAEKVGFEYKIKLVDDGNYGDELDDGTWDGMVGELMERDADLAVAPLTITYVREQVIDFSKPFMYLGVTILYRVPEPQNPGVFSFLNPLSFDIWMYIVMAYLTVSLSFFLLARFSPYEWYNSHPINPDYDAVENQFTLLSCLWFSFGGLMQQGSELNPRAFSTRVLSGFWWFFSLILVSSYTANLAAFLTVERMVSPIQNADDLAKQTSIEYGTRTSGSTTRFFKRSTIHTYEKMWDFMFARPHVFVQTYQEGIDRVLNSKNYAFLMESTMAEYQVSKHCQNLTMIGGLLNSRGYGVGTPLGSRYRDEITKAILQLQEDDILLQLKGKWWKSGQCQRDDNSKDDASELGLKNIGGIFLVLVAGLVLGVMVAIAEFVWKSKQNAEIDKKSLCAEMMAGLRFAFRCNGKKKAPSSMEHKFIPSPYPVGINGQMIPMTETVA
ncbi:glutamate receptor ionotropic, kainate 2-like [Diadema antillarum]|uniref:glutamate receptor ionotropic, kainate 2-like n=1 Tax=Diadema antillarum TaxID=105358 RepID=UPI003A8B7C5F